ncbi:ABC transporter ATP-binding protein [Proteocatella sphenisci]|uniref:ABC transporter ATP-binding protein n=1 Tax=Proteocatella sphenisci TaxID=181070 RepID=UPI00048B5E1A|nr:phosphate ABC transporter ATP-binding protein [Proteocatella sphenisci]
MTLLKIDKLKKTYDSLTVVDIPDLEIKSGKITAIIGPSGSGKSTLLFMINGLEVPSEGCIRFEGEVFSSAQSYSLTVRRKMAMVFQKPVMFNSSVYENIAYGLNVRKNDLSYKKEYISEKVGNAARLTGLESKLKQKAVTLSGGEAGRVSVARAMVTEPKLLLLDEPTASLDPQNISAIEDIVREANRTYGASVVIVTHNMFQARRIADEVIFLLDGKIIEHGSTESIFENPSDPRTRRFVSGEMIC